MPAGHGYAIFGLQQRPSTDPIGASMERDRSSPSTQPLPSHPLPSFEIEPPREPLAARSGAADPEIEYRVLDSTSDVFPDEPTVITPRSLPRPEPPPVFDGARREQPVDAASAPPRRHALPPPPFPAHRSEPPPGALRPTAAETPLALQSSVRNVGFSRTLRAPAPRTRSMMRVVKGAALFGASFVVAFGIAWASERSTAEKSLPVQLAVDAVAAAPSQAEAAPAAAEPVAAAAEEEAAKPIEAPAPEAPAAPPEAAAPEAPAAAPAAPPRPAKVKKAAPTVAATPPAPPPATAAQPPPRAPAAAPAKPAPPPEKPVAKAPPAKQAKPQPASASGPVLWAGDPELKKR